jgi:CRISPR-associated exonuclease Cas4
VEFEPDGTPYPVEYKAGSRAKAAWIGACDDLQLTAQALCLEEMMGKPVSAGAIYYAKSRRRREIAIDNAMRRNVEKAAVAVRRLLEDAVLPAPTFDERCERCSLAEICQPRAANDIEDLFAVED